jgi:hypothetical protein
VPIFGAPPTQPQKVPGYPGGKFDPEKRGATYFVCPDGGDPVFITNNTGAKWGLSALARRHKKQIGESGLYKLGCDAKGKDRKKFEFADRSVPYQFFRVDRVSEEVLPEEQEEVPLISEFIREESPFCHTRAVQVCAVRICCLLFCVWASARSDQDTVLMHQGAGPRLRHTHTTLLTTF